LAADLHARWFGEAEAPGEAAPPGAAAA
jgi:hypothetical protein